MSGHGRKRDRKLEQAISALLSEGTVEQAAKKAGVGYATLRRWLKEPGFREAYRQARRELVEGAVGRIQAATGQAVDTLLTVAKEGAKAGDRVRAAVALLDYALRGGTELADCELDFDGEPAELKGTGDVVKLLAKRLRRVAEAELPPGDKARLTATLADSLLRAIGVDVLDKRLAALEAVLIGRKDAKP
jgi:hypothetical protein